MDSAVVQDLLRQIEVKDLSTAAHTWRVVLYTRALAEEHGVDRETLELLTHGAALHDVGKLDIPGEILQKPGRLTAEEFEIIKLHTVAGFARMVQMDVDDGPILDLVKHHHERWDGGGYPFGLAAEAIPPAARYFAVIDAFDALTSIRPYRREIGEDAAERALELIEAERGEGYWPEAVDLFVELYRTGKVDHILRYFNDGQALPAFEAGRAASLSRRARRGG